MSLHDKKLRAYSGEFLPVIGKVVIPVTYNEQKHNLPLFVIDGQKPALLGRNCLKQVRLDWQSIFSIDEVHEATNDKLSTLLLKYESLFQAVFKGSKHQ